MYLSQIRDQHGKGFYTIIDDNTVIHWKPLSVHDVLDYRDQVSEGNISTTVLEDEIFRKCVLDNEYVKNMNELPAGIVSTVVTHIMEYSGPENADEFNGAMNYYRDLVAKAPIYRMLTMIVRVFPSYTLEQLLDMSFEDFLTRLAMAESVLLETKAITEPFRLLNEEEMEELRAEQEAKELRKRNKPNIDASKIDLKAMWEKQQQKHTEQQVATPTKSEISPIFDPKTGKAKTLTGKDGKPISLRKEVAQMSEEVGGDFDDELRVKMLRDAMVFYKPVIDKLAEQKK